MQINFKFEPGQRVNTPFGTLAIVGTCAFDDAGVQYYVKTESGGNWFKESDLQEVTQ